MLQTPRHAKSLVSDLYNALDTYGVVNRPPAYGMFSESVAEVTSDVIGWKFRSHFAQDTSTGTL